MLVGKLEMRAKKSGYVKNNLKVEPEELEKYAAEEGHKLDGRLGELAKAICDGTDESKVKATRCALVSGS